MTELYIFSQNDKPLTIITEDTGLVSAPTRIEVNSVPDTPFSFTVEADSENAEFVKDENKVVYRDHEGDLRLVVIKELDDSDSLEGPLTTATCEPEFMELVDHIVVDRRIVDKEVQVALDAVLDGTRYIGEVEVDLGLATTNFYYINSVDAIWQILSTWGGEFKDVVEFDEDNNIIARKIKLLQRLGADIGQRFEIDHNITEIGRTILSYPLTAMYGRGASLETDGGGNTRYIDFADVVWKKSNGDPVDKPLGQKWVGDPEALQVYGRLHSGKLLHREGIFSNQDYEDPEELLWATWNNLQANKRPEVNYRLSVDLFDDKVSLGDTAIAIDRYFSRPIEIQARIIAMEYDLLDIEGTMVVEMGQFLNLDDNRLDDIERDVENLKNRRPSNRVTEDSYPDTKPGTPINITTEGGMEVIQLYWDYDSSIYIKHYEVYGSQIKDFIPDSQHLLWRGDVSAFAHTVGTDEVWYYRIRAVNYHGTASDWSVQVQASTHRVISDDILFGEELAAKLRELSELAPLLADGSVDFDTISEEAKALINQESKTYTDDEIKATEEALLQELADKAGLEYVDGQLQLKADADTVSAIQTDITELETKANNLESEIIGISTNLSNLQTSVDEDISGLNTVADGLLKRMAENESALAGNNGKITSIVHDIDSINGSLSTTINQLSILDGVVSDHTTTINANTREIGLKATQSSVDTLTGRVSTAEGSISTIAGQVSLKANAADVYTKSQVNTELGKKIDTTVYNNKMSQLDVSINGITANVSDIQSSVSDVDSRLSSAESSLEVLPGQIAAKAEKSSVYTKTETDGRITSQINSAKSEIKVTTDGISQEVSRVEGEVDGIEIGGRNLVLNSKRTLTSTPIGQWGKSFLINVPIDGVKVKHGDTVTFSVYVDNIPSGQSVYGRLDWHRADDTYGSSSNTDFYIESGSSGRIYATGTIPNDKAFIYVSARIYPLNWTATYEIDYMEEQLEIGNKPTSYEPAPEDIDGAISDVQSYASSIDQKADSIIQSVSSLESTVDSHGTKISNAESTISQHATAISQRATKTELTTGLNDKVNTTTYNSKVGELTTSINGISGRVSNTEAEINDLTGEVNSAKSQIASLDVKADGIVQSVSQIESDLSGRISKAESTLSVLPGQIAAKVDEDGIVASLNLSKEGLRVKASLIELDGTTLIRDGIIGTAAIANAAITNAKLGTAVVDTLQVKDGAITNAKISSLNADKISASSLSAITSNMGTLRTGRLLSNNSSIDINLNTSEFKLGGNAEIHFTDRSNTLYYNNASVYGGVLFDHSLNGGGRPLVAIGVSDNGFDPNDPSWNGLRVHSGWVESNVSGVMTNIISNQLWLNQNPDYSGGGWAFENAWPETRNRALYGMSGFAYDLGFSGGGEFVNSYINNLRSVERIESFGEIHFRNPYSDSNIGWTMETTYGDNGSIDFYPINTGTPHYYNIGRTDNLINRLYVNIIQGNYLGTSSAPFNVVYTGSVVEGSDRNIKRNITPNQLGLDFINDLNTVDFDLNDTGQHKNGLIAQEVLEVLNKHKVTEQSIVVDGDVLGISYTQLIAPTIKAVQEVDRKVIDLEQEVCWLKTENQLLRNKIKILEEKVA